MAELADAGARFGVNYLVTPERLASLDTVVLELVPRGCRDVAIAVGDAADVMAAETGAVRCPADGPGG